LVPADSGVEQRTRWRAGGNLSTTPLLALPGTWHTCRRGTPAGVADRIELRIGPGLETLRALPPGEQFDFAFSFVQKLL